MDEKEYFEELERIAQKVYKENYQSLCFSKRRNVQTLLKAGGIWGSGFVKNVGSLHY